MIDSVIIPLWDTDVYAIYDFDTPTIIISHPDDPTNNNIVQTTLESYSRNCRFELSGVEDDNTYLGVYNPGDTTGGYTIYRIPLSTGNGKKVYFLPDSER